jgi:hypothetical protein
MHRHLRDVCLVYIYRYAAKVIDAACSGSDVVFLSTPCGEPLQDPCSVAQLVQSLWRDSITDHSQNLSTTVKPSHWRRFCILATSTVEGDSVTREDHN